MALEDRPQMVNGNTQYQEEQSIEYDELVSQLLSTAVSKIKWLMDTWYRVILIRQYFAPTGNNATALQAAKVSALWRRTDETFRTFIRRSYNEMSFLKSLGGEQPDYGLDGLL